MIPPLFFLRHSQTSWSYRHAIIESYMLLLLLLSRFSCVQLCVTPETAAHQAPSSLGFSRQEHWSGLPFPSPMHESEKWKWKVKVKSLSYVRLLATPWTAAYQAPLSMGFSRQEYWSGVPIAFSRVIHETGINNRYSSLASRKHSHLRVFIQVLISKLGPWNM